MQGITLYIILGILVGAIIIFLFVSSLLDRKKRKKLYQKELVKKNDEKAANMRVAIILKFIIDQNEALLKKFVPSVGKIKMSDIRIKARNSLQILEHSEPYSHLKVSESIIVEIFEKLKTHNANIWNKKLDHETKIITKLSLANYKLRTSDSQVKNLIKKVRSIYENDNSK